MSTLISRRGFTRSAACASLATMAAALVSPCNRARAGASRPADDYGPLKMANPSVDVAGELRVSLTIRNTGTRRGVPV